jgi:hypothetical protein
MERRKTTTTAMDERGDRYEDVLALEVAMQNTSVVEIAQGVGDLERHVHARRPRALLVLQETRQGTWSR